MSDVFNKNPNSFIDLNEFFPILNDKVGLTSDQWKKAIENSFYLYNNLGLANVLVGTVTTIFTKPGSFVDVEVNHREEIIDGKVFDYFDYVFSIPTPKIETAITNEKVDSVENVGMDLTQEEVYGTGSLSNVVVGYKFNFNNKFYEIIIDSELSETSENAIQNKTITNYVYNLNNKIGDLEKGGLFVKANSERDFDIDFGSKITGNITNENGEISITSKKYIGGVGDTHKGTFENKEGTLSLTSTFTIDGLFGEVTKSIEVSKEGVYYVSQYGLPETYERSRIATEKDINSINDLIGTLNDSLEETLNGE